MSRQDDLQKLIAEHERRLQKRKEQKARFGISADPSIDIEIEDIEAAIAQLQTELAELETRQGFTPQPGTATSPAVSPPVVPAAESDPKLASFRAQPRIFLCHASEDKPRVKELYHQLKEAGYHPWLDTFDLLPGQTWRREIEKIIRDPYSLVLVCLSNNSITKRGVVQQEIKWALDILDQTPEGTIYLIPVRLEECETPERLSDLHWVDLFEPDGFEYLTRALDYEINKRYVTPKPGSIAPAKTRSARSPEPKPAPPKVPQIPSPQQLYESEPLAQKLLKPLRDPIWQMIGVVVAIIGVAWAVYAFYAGGNILATPAPTPTIATVTAVSTQSIPLVNSPIPATDTQTAPPVPGNTPLPTYTPELPTNTPTPQSMTAPDGAPMVLVPAGPFEMGSNQGEDDAQPVHEVTLAAFYIDQYEVTNALYRSCVEAGGCEQPACPERYEAETRKNHPVVCVSWDQAQKYCEWRGGRLPTEAEWEKAARGTEGREYPWGDKLPDGTLSNFYNDIGDTTPVGSYPDGVSPYGAYDMAGNVLEWVADWYDEKYYSSSPAENPPGPPNGELKALRGGSWPMYRFIYARASSRYSHRPDFQHDSIGFRCVAVAP